MEKGKLYLEINGIAELNALYKALYALKFKGDTDLLEEIVRSPIFNKIFQRIADELHKEFQKLSVVEDRNIESKPRELGIVVDYLKDYEEFVEFDERVKREVIQYMLSPFHYKTETVKELMNSVQGS